MSLVHSRPLGKLLHRVGDSLPYAQPSSHLQAGKATVQSAWILLKSMAEFGIFYVRLALQALRGQEFRRPWARLLMFLWSSWEAKVACDKARVPESCP